MNNRRFLDIDDTILTKNLILPENISNSDNLTKQSDTKPFLLIQPTPGICVKTRTDSGEKVFLNICTSDKIPPSDDIPDAKLLDMLLNEKYSEFVIVMSIGNERFEFDKGGSPCATCDIIINTTYFKKCQENKHFLLFTILVVLDAVSNKFNKTLNRNDYVILKNRKVMGKLQQQKIEDREPRICKPIPGPLIEEISTPNENNYKEQNEVSEFKNISSEIGVNPKLNYVLLKQLLEGMSIHLIGIFQIPKGITSKEIEVLLNEDRIVITIDKTGLIYDLLVPYIINVTLAKCALDNSRKILRLDMPVENTSDNIQTS